MPRSTIRKDALRSRRAILDAAHELLADGGDASFAEIAQTAGVGQATVYRHFDNRADVLAALAEEGMGRLERKAAAAALGPESFEDLLRLVAAEQVRDQTLIAAIRRGELDQARVQRLTERARTLFREPLAAAQAASRVRGQLDLDDVITALAMLDGALAAAEEHRDRGPAASRALDLLLDGLRA
ncbi:MAG: TetR/AcrR family transcriptional regulator [Solirubrobacterales bacterium]